MRIQGTKGTSLKSPNGQGYEEDAFSIINGDERDTSCDNTNESVEDWCALASPNLPPPSPRTDDQWRAVFVLTANLICRSRWTREENVSRLEPVKKALPRVIEVLKMLPPLPTAVRPFGFSPDDLDELPDVLDRAAQIQYPLTAALGVEPVAKELKAGKDCDLLAVAFFEGPCLPRSPGNEHGDDHQDGGECHLPRASEPATPPQQ